MKKLLFPTDFSSTALHAATYGYALARQLKAHIILCNVINVPAEIPQSGMVAWPMEESDILLQDSNAELKRIKSHLELGSNGDGYKPVISYLNGSGTVTDVVNRMVESQEIDLVIIGTHGSGGLSTWLMGNHSREMIDVVKVPLLLVPPEARINQVKKILFASDFCNPAEDLKCIYRLITLARPLNAEILLTHIQNEKAQALDFQKWIKEFITDLSNKADYPHIYYQVIKSRSVPVGLDWLCGHAQIDMVAMVHRPHNFIDSVFRRSQTQKMARHTSVPLLVF
ncbi:MAG: Nucleotide-binding universal stress protein UspA family [Mucilaginibacter sp.]|nr:Nucleotide-binding universal stress protein UspA family [Mucilaginibacter sp.]